LPAVVSRAVVFDADGNSHFGEQPSTTRRWHAESVG
jgi:hypothetical protein